MGTILTGAQWKAKRKQAGLEKHAIKTHVGAKLDLHHKAKTTVQKLAAIEAVELELQKFKKELGPSGKKSEFADFIPEVDRILKDVRLRRAKLEERIEQAKELDTLTIKALMGGGTYTQNFVTYMKVTHTYENWEFLIASGKKPKVKAAKKVYETFCAPGASKPINIDDNLVQALALTAANEDWDNMDFKPARMAVLQLLTMDTLPKFILRIKEILAQTS